MEREVGDSALTRQSRRERTKTQKALELEKRKHGGKSVNGNLFGSLGQRHSTAKDWDESNESDTDDVIEVREEIPDAPRPNRTRRRPKALSHASTRGYTRTEEADGDLLSTILSAIKEVKASNVELIAELAEVKAQLAEAKAQLAKMVVITSNGSGPGRAPQQSYASVLTRPRDLSFSASQPVA